MTELSFLLDLLLNHDLQKVTKDLIAQRIREVEENLNTITPQRARSTPQAPSTIAAMIKHTDAPVDMPIMHTPEMVSQIAQTPATAAAMAARQEAISASINKRMPGEKARKW